MTQSPPPPNAATAHTSVKTTPLFAVHSFSFINSVGTGVVTSGIYFLTKEAYRFSDTKNYLLGVVLGITYIIGAYGTGKLLKVLLAKYPTLSHRAILAGLMLVMAGLCTLPWLADQTTAIPQDAEWPIWVLVVLYSPLTGILWPLVEAALSYHRSGTQLQRALGAWNVVWSAALVCAYVALAFVVQVHPKFAIMLLGGAHLVGLVPLAYFIPITSQGNAATHSDHLVPAHAPVPPLYRQLLSLFRLLLPVSYLVCTGMTPFLPTLTSKLGLSKSMSIIAATTWVAARVVVFAGLSIYPGWHGSRRMPVIGAVLLLAGFGTVVLSPLLPVGGLFALIAGLAAFGVGMATIYTGAIYYGLEVERDHAEGGSNHEALIGVGYTFGPLVALGAIVARDMKYISVVEPAIFVTVGAVAVGATILAFKRSRKVGLEPAPIRA